MTKGRASLLDSHTSRASLQNHNRWHVVSSGCPHKTQTSSSVIFPMRLSLVARIFRPAFHTKCLSLYGSFSCQIPPQARLGIEMFEQLPLFLGMAIFARPADTQSGPTLMGRVLLSPIRNRVGYGFLKKKTRNGFGSSSGFI